MDREELKKYMPHREPMLLIDEACDHGDGSGSGSYTVKGGEWFLQGHFPGKPVVPGVIQCEMMAQACSMLLKDKLVGNIPLFTGIEGVKFKNMVTPGDKIDIKCRLKKVKEPFFFTEAEAYVGGKLCAKGQFSFALVKGE